MTLQTTQTRFGWLRFGKCRVCGDPVKRRGARLCSSCWWAAHPTSHNAQPPTSGRRDL